MIETERLILRRWAAEDIAPLAALNADPEVMRHFPQTLGRAETEALVLRLEGRWATDGIGFGAVVRKCDGAFVGMAGLSKVGFAPLAGATEIGWRLARPHWGQGYATEAARAWLGHGFGTMGLSEIVAFTVPANLASRRLMRRLGLRHDPARDFDHPLLPEGHALRAHVLYAATPGDVR